MDKTRVWVFGAAVGGLVVGEEVHMIGSEVRGIREGAGMIGTAVLASKEEGSMMNWVLVEEKVGVDTPC